MGCFRLFDNNFADIDIIANYDASSEDAAFPIENAFNKQRRSKVWRSAGYFNITSSNNTIIFRETVGVDLTATITVGEYTSITTMCTAIKTALEAAGASTYTVTNSSTTSFKFRITSNGSGGGGIFQLMLTDVLFTADGILGFDDTIDFTGALTYDADYLRINTSEYILFDLGVSSNPTAFALCGARNRALKISPTATIKLQGNETNNWTTPSFTTTLTYDDSVIVEMSATGFHTSELRYWRVLFEDQNPLGYIEVGAFFLGEYYAPTQGVVQFPLQSSYIDRSEITYSEGGQEYSDIREKSQSFSVTWNGLTKTEIEDIDEIFNVYGTSLPFFVSMDSDEVYSSVLNRRVRFVKFADEPSYSFISPNLFTMTMQFREQL